MDEIKAQLLNILRLTWRQKWLGFFVAAAIAVCGWIAVFSLPDVYESKARVYADTESLLQPLLKGIAVQGNISSQVKIMQRTLLSRPNIVEVIHKTDMDLDVHDEDDMERLVFKMAENMKIKAEGLNLFSLSYSGHDPKQTQRIVDAFLNIFVENNLGQNRVEAESAKIFLDDQLKIYETKLREKEAKIAAFKSRNASYVSSKGDYGARLEEKRLEERLANEEISNLTAAITELTAQLETIAPFVDASSLGQDGAVARGTLASLEERIHELESALDSLTTQYTNEHPDIQSTRKTLRKLQKEYQDTAEKIQSGEFDPSIISSKVPNPLHDEIRVKIIDNETALAIKKEELSRIKVELQQLNEIADIAPQVDIQLRDLSRDYEILQTNYQEFLERRESAAIAQAAGSINSTEFRIIDPPEVPLIPTGPLRSLFYLLVTFFAFAAGAAVAFLKSEFQDCFISLSDLRAAYGEKVLGGVSNVHSSSYQAETKRENIIFGSLAGGILGIGIMLSLISL